MADLNANQSKALAALLTSTSVSEAAAACGLGERTIYRYLSDETFRQELRNRQDETIGAAAAALAGLTGKAIKTLHDLLNDKKASHNIKLRAALAILQEGRRTAELDGLIERMREIEAIIAQAQPTNL